MAVGLGLNKAAARDPGGGYLDLALAWSQLEAARAHAELGWRFAPRWAVFADGWWSQSNYGAGVGVRGEW